MILIGAVCLATGLAIALLWLPRSAPDLSAYKFTPVSRQGATERDPDWSPDGKSITFAANVHGIDQAFTKAIDSPDTAQITHSASNCRSPFWSRDGATIYYFSQNAMWAVPASGGPAEVVLDNTMGATVHPNGQTVVFVRDGKLWIASLKGEQPREFAEARFAATSLVEHQLKFLPDGSKLIAFTGTDIWILQFPSGTPRKVPGTFSSTTMVTWCPDSRHVVEMHYSSTYILSLMDTSDGSRQVIYSTPEPLLPGSVSRDWKRIAYTTGQAEWDVLEISLPSGAVSTRMHGSGVICWSPDWAPSGTHYLASTNRSGTFAVEDISATEFFSRRLVVAEANQLGFGRARWAPDRSRFVFMDLLRQGGSRLMVSNSAGGRPTVLDADVGPVALSASWSPDGQWVVYARRQAGKAQLVKLRPGAGTAPVALTDLAILDWLNYPTPQWSPDGNWIAYPAPDGLELISPNGKTTRKLTTRKLQVFGFSREGGQLFGIFHNTTVEGAQWQLYSVDLRTGAEKLLGPVDLPASTESLAGFSLHPDGKRFLMSIGKLSFDIWMLEGFDQHKSWLKPVLRR